MLTRVRQFREAGRGPDAGDLLLAEQRLEPVLLQLFMAQEPRDMSHAARTARWLMERGHDERELLQAALLHDIGKGHQRRRDRVAYVVSGWLRAEGLLASEQSRFRLRRAVSRSRKHSATGAVALERAGAPARVVELTRFHHEPKSRDAMLKALSEADAAS